MSRRFRVAVLVSVGVLTLIILAFKLFGPKPTYAELAEHWMEAILEGDAGGLEYLVPQSELDAYGWSASDVSRFFDKFVKPRTAKYRLASSVDCKLENGGYIGRCRAKMTDGQKMLDMFTKVEAGPSGPRATIKEVLYTIWLIEYLADHEKPPANTLSRMIQRGIERDRAQLTSLGLKGLVEGIEKEEFMSWDLMEARLQQRLSQPEKPGLQ